MNEVKITKDIYPDVGRNDIGLMLFSEWKVEHKEDQRKAADASMENMESIPWPEGLIAYSSYLGTDEYTILHYSQWENEKAHLDFLEKSLPKRLEQIGEQIELSSRNLLGKFRLYRSETVENAPDPGCIVIVHAEFTDPETTPKWIDLVFEALASEEQEPDGGISGHFHIIYDGLSMINYAEWTSEEAHQKALDGSGRGAIGVSSLWQQVQEHPGLKKDVGSVKRYTFYKSLIRV